MMNYLLCEVTGEGGEVEGIGEGGGWRSFAQGKERCRFG